jgi:hypothetical protein
MDQQERTALKAACIQAAAILVAGQSSQMAVRPINPAPAPDTGACVRFARDLFGKLTHEAWDEP